MEREKIEYELKRSKIKNVYIRIENGKVLVSAPKRVPQEEIDKIIKEKYHWITKKVEEDIAKGKVEKQYIDGETFKLLGKEYQLDIAYHSKERTTVEILENKMIVNLGKRHMQGTYEENKEEIRKKIDLFYKKEAEKIIPEEIERLSQKTNLSPKGIKIKKMKRAWGNCSSQKIITINYQLIEHSLDAVEYVIIHELCHLKEMNHSKEFWKLVERFMPNYKEVQKELK